MKKALSLFVYMVAMLSLASCEEEDAPILLSEVSNSNPENVSFKYYSPDQCCVGKMYWITANSQASELTVKCTNADAIFIKDTSGKTSEEYTSSNGQWKAVLVNPNTITFTFAEYQDDSEDGYYTRDDGFNVIAQTKKGTVQTSIAISRLTKTSGPLDY